MQKFASRLGRASVAASLLALAAAAAPAAFAAPASVTLRVEGSSETIFEGQVTTDGHDVTTASGGTHSCDGTNGGVNPERGPTATAALDDAARIGRFTWDGVYNQGFDDYLVGRIGPESQTPTQFWAFLVNSQLSQLGGCQQRVRQGDEVLWAFDAFSKAHVLRLAGPGSATAGRPTTLRVTDARDGAPQAGATVAGSVTGGDGGATLTFPEPGVYRLKAERPDSIRSNALVLCVDPEGAEPCTSSDRGPPTVRLLIRGRYASDFSTSRTFTISWQGDDATGGSGVASYSVDVREPAAATAADDGWRRLVARTTRTSISFHGRSGRAYQFRVSALDRAGNRGLATATVLVPIDDRDRHRLRLSRGWRRLERKGAWGRFVVRSRRVGASARLRFRGTGAVVVGRRLRRGGGLRVSVDGWSKVFRLRGKPGHRQVLARTPALPARTHDLRLRAAGGGPVELDAVAVVP